MIGKRCAVFLSLIILIEAFSQSDINDWKSFKEKYSKHYASHEEDMHRFQIFLQHKSEIAHHNLDHDNGVASFKMGLNEYSDLSHEEFVNTMNGHIFDNSSMIYDDDDILGASGPSDFVRPEKIDWRVDGAVTHVKRQKGCGSCYAFATAAVLESHHFLKTKELVSLSEQYLVDCSQSFVNRGCNGGNIRFTLEYVQNHGIDTEESDPYMGVELYRCKLNGKKANVKFDGISRVPRENEEELQKALALHGPIAVAIDASSYNFQSYRGGIYHATDCDPHHLTHGVLLVGYDTNELGEEYYILKNSFGTEWGENGYFKLPRNQNNYCGIATAAVYPISSSHAFFTSSSVMSQFHTHYPSHSHYSFHFHSPSHSHSHHSSYFK